MECSTVKYVVLSRIVEGKFRKLFGDSLGVSIGPSGIEGHIEDEY